ncbi:hypothetical protein CDIK_0161 [Cucumispora dikerogammari]|nr:hypothetical protein CDIK_0161 [Cucumispora dikerogammari]
MLSNHFHLYPIYFNPELTKSQGRKYPLKLCKAISVQDISQYISQYKRIENFNDNQVTCQVEQKNHPKSNNIRCTKTDLGRIRIDYGTDLCKNKIIEFIKSKLQETKSTPAKQSKFIRIKKDKKFKK